MTWISLVCLLAMASSAFCRSAYGGGYSSVAFPQVAMREKLVHRPFLPSIQISEPAPAPVQTGFGQQQTGDWSSQSTMGVRREELPWTQKVQTGFDSSFTGQTFPKA